MNTSIWLRIKNIQEKALCEVLENDIDFAIERIRGESCDFCVSSAELVYNNGIAYINAEIKYRGKYSFEDILSKELDWNVLETTSISKDYIVEKQYKVRIFLNRQQYQNVSNIMCSRF